RFEYRDLGAVALKGLATPLPAWQVLGPSAVASRFEALRGAALSRLIGRDEEIELLLRRWGRAKAGVAHPWRRSPTASRTTRNFSPTIMMRPGSSKNLSPAGARRVINPSPGP